MGRTRQGSREARGAEAGAARARLGRPSVPREERRSNRVVTFLTDSELTTLQSVAAEDGSSLSAAIHRILAASLSRRQRR